MLFIQICHFGSIILYITTTITKNTILMICFIRYHHWNHYCVKISSVELRRERTIALHGAALVAMAAAAAVAMSHHYHRQHQTQEYAIVQIRQCLYRQSPLRRQHPMARSHRRALTMIHSYMDRIRKREICCAHTAASNFPIKRFTSCIRDVIASQIRGSVTFARRRAPMSTSSIRICSARAINEDLIISSRENCFKPTAMIIHFIHSNVDGDDNQQMMHGLLILLLLKKNKFS